MTRKQLHQTYALAIAVLVMVGGLAWNYSWTAEHNRLVIQSADTIELNAMMDAAQIDLLPPPAI